MGCFVLLIFILSPRLGTLALWLFTDWVEKAFNDGFILPILGLALLPWTTGLYVVGYNLGDGANPWGYLGIFVGLFLDVALHAGSATMTRRRNA